MITTLFLLFLGFTSGIFAGILGIGGGIIFLPFAKLYFIDYLNYHNDFMKILIATAPLIVSANTLSSVIAHSKNKNVMFSLAKYFIIACILGTQIGGLFMTAIPTIYLEFIIASLLFIAAIKMIFNKDSDNSSKKLRKKDYYLIFISAFLISFLTAVSGIGAGSKMTIVLYLIIKLPLNKTIGTTSLFTFFVAFFSLIFYLTHNSNLQTPDSHIIIGYVDITISLLTVIGGVIGSFIGAKLVNILPHKITKRIFITFLLFGAIKMIF